MASRDIHTFFELRNALELIHEGSGAALRFMDANGLAIERKRRIANTNGSGKNIETLKTAATKLYTQSRAGRKPRAGKASEPDGTHFSLLEAAKVLKCSEANVRLMIGDGRLPKAGYELRGSKKRPHVKKEIMVVPKDAVFQLAEARKAEEAKA